MDSYQKSFIEEVSEICSLFTQFPDCVCDFIGCQFALESNFGISSLAKVNHNFCGMKNPLVRISCAIHAGDPLYKWAEYFSIQYCVYDFLMCLQYYKPISCDYDTIEHFGCFLAKFYCSDKDYISKIKKIYRQFKS